jgi:hypothetical protein
MAVVVTNEFGGIASGTNVATTNTAIAGDPFDVVSIGTGTTLQFDSTHAVLGATSCKVATGSTATTALAEWTTTVGTQTTVFYRQYLYFTAFPSANLRPMALRSGGSLAAAIGITTSGKIQLINAANAVLGATANSIPLNQWFRIEGFVTGSATVGVISLTLYNDPNGYVATETQTFTGANTTGALTQYWFGQQAGVANVGPYWMDGLGISTGGFLGPSYLTPVPVPLPVFPAGTAEIPQAMNTLIQAPFTFVTGKVMLRAQQSASQSIAGATTLIHFGATATDILEDPYGGWSATLTATQPAWSWLCPVGATGWYEVTSTAFAGAGGATDQIQTLIFRSGTLYRTSATTWAASSINTGVSGSVLVPLAGGLDYIQGYINTSYSTNTTATAGQLPTLEIAWVST